MPESNVVAAAAVFVSAIVCDALTSLPSLRHADVPASLRGSSLVTLCCLASPVVASVKYGAGRNSWLQRPFVGGLLVILSLLGEHHGKDEIRSFDAGYILITLGLAFSLYWTGGIDLASAFFDSAKPYSSSQGRLCCNQSVWID